jgi:hypothetical protein
VRKGPVGFGKRNGLVPVVESPPSRGKTVAAAVAVEALGQRLRYGPDR